MRKSHADLPSAQIRTSRADMRRIPAYLEGLRKAPKFGDLDGWPDGSDACRAKKTAPSHGGGSQRLRLCQPRGEQHESLS